MGDNEFDCHCPQYVDFLAGLSSGEGDSFFGETGGTPKFHMEESSFRERRKDFHLFQENVHYQVKSESVEELEQMTLSKIPSESYLSHTAAGAFYLVTPLRRRSKSESSIHPKLTERAFKMPHRLRSSSANDLRPKKKTTYATTPMCLKRTLVKSKAKKIKTTEEIELEKIAELQKQLSDHLRFNERNLRRMKLQPKTTIPKAIPRVQESNAKSTRKKIGMKSTAPLAEVIETVTNNMRSKFKNRLLRINELSVTGHMNGLDQAVKTSVKKQCTKPKQPKFEEACSSKMANEKESKLLSKRPLPVKYGFHSGLTLVENPKKTIVVKPFNFDKTKLKDVKNGRKVEMQFLNFMTTPQVKHSGKENILLSKITSFSEVKVVKKGDKINSQDMSFNKFKQKSEMNVLKDRNKV